MNVRYIGEEIEEIIKDANGLDEDELGFDASYHGFPIEIKGCIPTHQNGASSDGKYRTTKGRFWIDNRAHKSLLEHLGSYIFVLYETPNDEVKVLKTSLCSAFEVDKMITTGKNTKIRYDRIFLNAKHGVMAWG